MEKLTLLYNKKEYCCQIKRMKMTSLRCKVEYDCIIVHAPKAMSLNLIKKMLLKSFDIIEHQLIENKKKPQHTYLNGDEFLFLGLPYKLIKITSDNEKVLIEEDLIKVFAKNVTDTVRIKKILRNFYLKSGKAIIAERNKIFCEKFGLAMPQITLSITRSVWGTCYFAKNRINYSYYLIFTRLEYIDYVIAHEMAHFKVSGHQKKFWEQVEQYNSNYKLLKKQLNNLYDSNFLNIQSNLLKKD